MRERRHLEAINGVTSLFGEGQAVPTGRLLSVVQAAAMLARMGAVAMLVPPPGISDIAGDLAAVGPPGGYCRGVAPDPGSCSRHFVTARQVGPGFLFPRPRTGAGKATGQSIIAITGS